MLQLPGYQRSRFTLKPIQESSRSETAFLIPETRREIHRKGIAATLRWGGWSNGPVWVEYLAQQLALPFPVASTSGGTNYSWGGGTTGSIPGLGVDIDVQVDTYLQNYTPGGTELFVVLGGINDSFLGQRNASVAVNKLMASISRLSDAAARHFLVGNLPVNVGIYESLNEQLKVFAPSFNERLWSALDELQANSNGVSVHKFDFYSLYNNIVGNPSGFGLTDITHPRASTVPDGMEPNWLLDACSQILWQILISTIFGMTYIHLRPHID